MSRIKIPNGLCEWNSTGEDYLPGLLGIEFTQIDEVEVRARMAVRKSLLAWNGFIECVARAVHKGRTTLVWDAEVNIEGVDKTIARFRCTQLILRSQ
jgi:acyl-coenzyme A thioesterase PaaI-like protein